LTTDFNAADKARSEEIQALLDFEGAVKAAMAELQKQNSSGGLDGVITIIDGILASGITSRKELEKVRQEEQAAFLDEKNDLNDEINALNEAIAQQKRELGQLSEDKGEAEDNKESVFKLHDELFKNEPTACKDFLKEYEPIKGDKEEEIKEMKSAIVTLNNFESQNVNAKMDAVNAGQVENKTA